MTNIAAYYCHMPSYNDAFYTLLNNLKNIYDEREAAAMAHEVMEHVTGLGKLDRIINKDKKLDDTQEQELQRIATNLANSMPLQYALGTAWFMGRPFVVDSNVLIPRPETEELVTWIARDHFSNKAEISILDVGTGSGCIPISLKLALKHASITSCDISAPALAVAAQNAARLNADISFLELDFLKAAETATLPVYDVIVSNPPYIPGSEAANMHANVSGHEPHLALFVPDSDPLLFYKAIAAFGKTHLKPQGSIYCELHADHAFETRDYFMSAGYEDVVLKQDMHGNPRMLKAML